jgi:hypothetical protein
MIIESKNFSGYLFYDQYTKRLNREYKNQEDSFPDPISSENLFSIPHKKTKSDPA